MTHMKLGFFFFFITIQAICLPYSSFRPVTNVYYVDFFNLTIGGKVSTETPHFASLVCYKTHNEPFKNNLEVG